MWFRSFSPYSNLPKSVVFVIFQVAIKMRVEVKVTLYHKPLKSFFACYVKQTQKPTDTLTGSNSSLLRTPPNPVVIGGLNVVSSALIKGQIKTFNIWIDLIISAELPGTEESLLVFFPLQLHIRFTSIWTASLAACWRR